MRAVILPGLDGSGELLGEFATSLAPQLSPRIVTYPKSGRLAYPQLTELALAHLPDDRPFVLIAESFSGPVGIQLAALRPAGLTGLVLCATFAAPHVHGRNRCDPCSRCRFRYRRYRR